MKKLNKLFAILIAVLSASTTAKAYTSSDLTASGWTEVTSLPKSNEELSKYYYVFYATEADLMLAEEKHGTQENQLTGVYRTPADPSANKKMVWTLEYNESHFYGIRNLTNPLLLLQSRENAPWRVQAAWEKIQSEWTQWDFIYADGTWTIKNKLAKGADANDHIGPWDTKNFVDGSVVAGNKEGDDIGNFKIYAISRYTFDNINTDFDYESATAIAPLNITPLIVNAGFEYAAGWWNYTAKPGVLNNNSLEYWNGTASNLQFDINQSISKLPAGKYELKAELFNSYNGQAAGTNGGRAYLYASVYDGTTTTEYKTVVEPTTESTLTSHQTVLFVPSGIASENIKVTIGVKTIGTMDARWFAMDNFQLFYCGVDLTAVVQATYDELNGLSKEAVPTAFSDEMEELLNKYKTLPNTEDGLTSANNELKDLIATYHLVSGEYTKLQTLIATCESIAENSTETTNGAKATFTTAINSAKTNAASATTADAIKGIYNTLETARQTYVKAAEPLNGIKFDYTFMVVNPKFDEGTNGWNFNTGAPNWGIATNQGGAITGPFFENWKWESYTGDIYQELTGLPKGKYRLTAAAFRDQLIEGATDGDAVYVFANDAETLVNDKTPAFYSVEVSTTTGTLRFGVRSKVEKYRWMGIDNITLQYVEALDLSEFIAAYNAALEAAEAARDNAEYFNITGQERTALEEAINNVPEENQDALSAATVALQSATAAFTAVKADYDLLATEKQTAKGLGMSDDLITTTIGNNTASVALLDLREAEYDYVTKEFSYPVELEANGWIPEGPVGSLTGQHYDGSNSSSYLEQSSSAWGSSAWEISYKYEKTLPAGKYIFKVAGRRAAGTGTTMGLTVTNVNNSNVLGSVNDFPEGDTGLGINKKGKTSFDANDPEGFANNGAGRGWQWRYVMFELSSETTVQVAVNAAATTNHQWMSFCGASLQMTEETYLEANKGGLDAPTAAAQALVNAVPMGAEKIAALNSALNLPVTTGQELLDKIEALNTAIANANAWVGEYNNAKAPLVAALERFEADYNDAQNGALNHMNKGRWATAISMAQAAAVAKDVTDSYDGFEEAANNLVAALDEATTSVNEYAALKSAIDNAEELGGGDDWGDEPFQKSESAKESFNTTKTEAQTAYDAAEVDGEGVTTVIESLNTAINKVVLNAPEEGQRYYIKVATDGHGKKNNAWLVTLGATSDNNPTGYGINANNVVKAHLPQAFIFTQVEGNLYNISIERAEGTVYLTYGALNESAAGWKNQQIQATTDAEKKGEFKIVPTGKKGVLKIFNTIDNNYLDCQDGGSIYTDTNIENEEFAFKLATETEVTLTLSEVGWATLILPFDAELPEGVKAWSCGKVNGEELTLNEASSIKANTPYLISGNAGTYNFSGYGLADKDNYAEGLFTGTYVDFKTEANSNTYVLQKKTIDGKDDVAFYLVGDSAQPTVGAYRCYMTYEATPGESAATKFSFGRGEGTTSIDNMESTANSQQPIVIYDLMGRKVNTMEKGGIYIVNGKKVIVK